MGGIIPDGSKIFGVIGYCLAMAIFTMIMGNAFAAFAVITAGVGVPFVINLGANLVIVGSFRTYSWILWNFNDSNGSKL